MKRRERLHTYNRPWWTESLHVWICFCPWGTLVFLTHLIAPPPRQDIHVSRLGGGTGQAPAGAR